jgi:hypothetical protein
MPRAATKSQTLRNMRSVMRRHFKWPQSDFLRETPGWLTGCRGLRCRGRDVLILGPLQGIRQSSLAPPSIARKRTGRPCCFGAVNLGTRSRDEVRARGHRSVVHAADEQIKHSIIREVPCMRVDRVRKQPRDGEFVIGQVNVG